MNALNHFIATLLPYLPKKLVWMVSKQYVAGESIENGIAIAKTINEQGIWVTIDLLGEFTKTIKQAENTKNEYLRIIDRFEEEGIIGNFSLKPTSFGMLIDNEKCVELIREVVLRSAQHHNFIRIDMEDSQCTDREIELYRQLKKEFPHNVGLVLQAYLRRTRFDLQKLIDEAHTPSAPINIRLCKGIYVENEAIAFNGHQEIRNHYLDDLRLLFEHGAYVAIATHDKFLIDGAFSMINELNIPSSRYEFQMLYGVTPNLRDSVIATGNKMRLYVPFGHDWFGYCTRRIKENPKIASDIIRALFVKG